MNPALDDFARTCLGKLLDAGERNDAGVRKRAAALTGAALIPYRTTTSLHAKEAFENVILAAAAAGAITASWDVGYAPRDGRTDGFIRRIDLLEIGPLAVFLRRQLAGDKIALAAALLSSLQARYPIISPVLARWSRLKMVRGLRPDDAADWIDAVKVLDYCTTMRLDGQIATPLREASARLFKDSKRIEKLGAALDMLLSNDVDAEARPLSEVCNEIGLFREEHPVRLAGNIVIVRQRVSSILDKPYIGLPAPSIVRLGTAPRYVLSIENQTTFHSEARRLCDDDVLLIYTAGTPTPAWRLAYQRLLSSLQPGTPVYHWGDVDEGGFRIAALIAREAKTAGHLLQPWRMHPEDVPVALRRPTTEGVAKKMCHYAEAAGWSSLGEALFEAKITIEQEVLGNDS